MQRSLVPHWWPAAAGLGATSVSATGEGEPQPGGTLIVAGDPDVLWMDPTAAYSAADYQFQRMTLRGLFDYPNSGTLEERATPLPDLAVEVPTEENGGISADGLTYTIELRDDVVWNVDEPRPVVAEDVVRGVKRMCNPVQGSAARAYYLDTIAGMREFCDGFAEVAPEIEPIRDYIESNDIAGVTAVDDHTVQFTLTQPASDFVYLLALFRFAAPQPVEYLDYLADSPDLRQNIIENGPYQVVEYVPDQSYVLERNPNWDPETDDLREAYVDRIEITLGQENESVFQQIIAGTVDMQWGETTVPTQEIPALLAAGDERLVIEGAGGLVPYIVINTLSPNADGAFGDPLVRQALNFAVDREAVQQIFGGPNLSELAFHILPPEVPGSEDINPLNIPPGGDPERARELLAEAGYPDGLPIKVLYDDEPGMENLAAVLEQVLGDSGFDVEFVFQPSATPSTASSCSTTSSPSRGVGHRPGDVVRRLPRRSVVHPDPPRRPRVRVWNAELRRLQQRRTQRADRRGTCGQHARRGRGAVGRGRRPGDRGRRLGSCRLLQDADPARRPSGRLRVPPGATQRRLHQRLARAVTRSTIGELSRTSTRFFPRSWIDTELPQIVGR